MLGCSCVWWGVGWVGGMVSVGVLFEEWVVWCLFEVGRCELYFVVDLGFCFGVVCGELMLEGC